MQNKHSFVSFLDLTEILPFASTNDSDENMGSLFKFLDTLSHKLKEKIYYIGQDNIGERFYERFLFEKGGFIEMMTQKPVAIVAHVVEEKRARRCADVLKLAIIKIKAPAAKIVADSVETSTERENVLDYKTWSKLRNIHEEIA